MMLKDIEILKSNSYILSTQNGREILEIDISFIVMSFNNCLYIEECLLSIEKQQSNNFEIIIVDDGSSDLSQIIISNFIKSTSLIAVAYLSQLNRGIVKNYNQALKVFRGKYLCHIAADDINFPNRLLNSFETIKLKKCSMIISEMELIDANGRLIKKGGPLQYEQDMNFVIHSMNVNVSSPSMFYDSLLIKKFGLLPENLDNEDEALAIRAIFLDGIVVINEALVKYRKHTSSITSSQVNGNLRYYLNWLLNKDLKNQINNKLHWIEILKRTNTDKSDSYIESIQNHIINLEYDSVELKEVLDSKSLLPFFLRVLLKKKLFKYLKAHFINIIRPHYYNLKRILYQYINK